VSKAKRPPSVVKLNQLKEKTKWDKAQEILKDFTGNQNLNGVKTMGSFKDS